MVSWRMLFFMIICSVLAEDGLLAVPVPIARHDARAQAGDIYGYDVEHFGVSDTLQFYGIINQSLEIHQGPGEHSRAHRLECGQDPVKFTTRIEYSVNYPGSTMDGRPLFIPTGEQKCGPVGALTSGLEAPDRKLRIRTYDTLFGRGEACAVFDYSREWRIDVRDKIEEQTEVAQSTLGVSYGAGGIDIAFSYSKATTEVTTAPTMPTVARCFPDKFEFELTQPTFQGGENSDAKQGYFASGGTLTVTGWIKPIKCEGEGVIWFENYSIITYDEVFEAGDGVGAIDRNDDAWPGDVGDLCLRANMRTVAWDDYYCIPEPATIALLGLGALALLRPRRGCHRRR